MPWLFLFFFFCHYYKDYFNLLCGRSDELRILCFPFINTHTWELPPAVPSQAVRAEVSDLKKKKKKKQGTEAR